MTEAQSILKGGLKRVSIPEWVRAAVFCKAAGEDETAMKMAEFIADNRNVTPEELLNEARKISRE